MGTGWGARAALVAGALLCANVQGAPPTPKVAAAASCTALAQAPTAAKAVSPPVSLAPLTEQVAAGDHADFILSAPPGGPALTNLNYTIQFVGKSAEKTGLKLPITSQQASEDQFKKADLTAGVNAVVLRVAVPAAGRLNPFGLSEDWTISVVGCPEADQAQTGIYASRIIRVNEPNVARFWAAILVACLYVAAATCVWANRKTAARAGNGPIAAAPVRIASVQAWSWWRCLDPVVLSSDMYDRGSLSQLQILFFAGVIVFGMTELALTTGSLSSLSPAIVYLLGIPAAGTLSAQLAGASRDRLSADNWAWLVGRGVLPVNDPGSRTPKWQDLVMQDDAELDLSKLQALGFSIVVGIALIQAGFSGLGSFTIPSELLQILALSQVVFVGGRFTKPATMSDIDQLITTLRSRYTLLATSARSGLDLNPDGTLAAGAAAPITTFADAKVRLPHAVAQYSEIASEVAILLDGLTHRSVATEPIKAPDLS